METWRQAMMAKSSGFSPQEILDNRPSSKPMSALSQECHQYFLLTLSTHILLAYSVFN